MNRNESSRSFGRFGARATTFAGLAAATAAFVSLRGGFFTRGASAEFVRPTVAFDALQDGVIEVPTEATSIQAAIDFAPDGSTIKVAAGTYAGGIHSEGKSITITGAGADATLIRGFANSPVFSFAGTSSDRVIISGLSVVGGRGDAGCGIFLENVSFEVRDAHIAGNQGAGTIIRGATGDFNGCVFEDNRGPQSGGGARNDGGSPTFVGCTFRHNISSTFGGAVYSKGGKVALLACTVEDNSTSSGAWGGAIFGEDAHFELHGTDFARNRALESGGAVYLLRGVADISRCSFTGNFSDEARSLFSRGAGVRIASSHLCGASGIALGGDMTFEDDNVFDTACFGDCNQNGVSDSEELALGWSADRDGNGVLDACDPDCNSNGMPDGYEIRAGFAQDMNVNGMIDICEIRAGLALDVDNDWIPDDAQQVDAPAAPLAPAAQAVPNAGGAAQAPGFDPADMMLPSYSGMGMGMRPGLGQHMAAPYGR